MIKLGDPLILQFDSIYKKLSKCNEKTSGYYLAPELMICLGESILAPKIN